ncbi:zinc knuckle domain protein [Aspergillus clavatus NRRL 1]|uniref:Zinc knuckle domain protein n=1 Tax=Aspergillus clavatus (strain ATCC 1007 / CBS 513.65 / DSM 816 / NCTC 3887 / NRRL 1 / QM 1276 / 107) TaxID=344612 RepID=A1CIP7_ASPCL|nr:zinc knuckle domain protein [Aspergillus clavatus NRRL 1]EAW10752.1 zinc knuckle domain protein [Aspergillus clavatus NRRL 1]
MAESENENDSRTASVGVSRPRIPGSNSSSRHNSTDSNPNPRKRRRRNGKPADRDVRDFVPQGATFSATSLEVDLDRTSSSGSDSSESDSDSDGKSDASDTERQNSARMDPQAPAVNWNKGSKSGIRTSLGRRADKTGESKQTAQFNAVNDKFWRSRSDSVSSGGGEQAVLQDKAEDDMEEGEVDEEDEVSAESSEVDQSGDSDDSVSLDSEADDSILLNVGSQGDENGALSPATQVAHMNGSASKPATGDSSSESKEQSHRLFSQKYSIAPTTLADLDRNDMEVQARCLFYDRDINDINLQAPISCTECFKEGHLAAVCPLKECVHCGAWNQHQSIFCPSWRRCQRCRERGHDEEQCPSLLKGSATEIPCDLCGSADHLELQCDFMWKLPRPDSSPGPVLVSISCSHCTSNRHLVGDCPSLSRSMISSSFTLRSIDPNMVTNINSVVGARKGPPAPMRGQTGLQIRGRADRRSPSSDSEDMMSRTDRARPPINRNRGNIRIGNGIGRGKNLAPAGSGSRPSDRDTRHNQSYNYRDRQDYAGPNHRQRSMSPNPNGRPIRGRANDRRQPPPRSPPRNRPEPSRSGRGGGNGGGRGRGGRGGGGNRRGGGGGSNGDMYRPMPSAAKKAWDKGRL